MALIITAFSRKVISADGKWHPPGQGHPQDDRQHDAGSAALPLARGAFSEDEGMSLILPKSDADRLGLTYDTEMRQITLMVFSSLTGVGLTAAVSTELAREKIPANIVAATQHDHVFVPSKQAERAMALLRGLQARARADE